MPGPLLITGGSGYLGRHLTARAADRFAVYTTHHRHPAEIAAGQPVPLDLTDRAAVFRLLERIRPRAVIHTAAVNPGQGDETLMMQVNAAGSRHLAEAATAVGARLVHISTDVLHDGRHAPYADDAPPAPLNGYAHSKAAAEAAVRQVCPSAAIVRISLVYGLTEMDRGTAGFVKQLQTGAPLVLFGDVIRQPVWVDTLCEALLKLVDLDFAGVLNVAGRQAISRADFGRKMLAWWGLDPGDQLQTGRAADLSATIPLDLRLQLAKAGQLLQMAFPGVDEVLAAGLPGRHLPH